MLTCREVAERAEDWLDQDMGTWQALQMRLHLAMCKGCNRFISQMRLTQGLTDAAANIDNDSLSEGADQQVDAILSRVQNEKQSEG